MLKIGTIGLGECDKCIHFDEKYGCKIINKVSVTRTDEAVYCIDGIEVEERSE
jgi:hypothetical protein